MTIKYLLTGMSIITVFVSVTPSLAQQASAQPDVTIRWPVASQKVQAEGEWITIDESSPESDRVIIPRLFHVIREVLVSDPAADSTWRSVEMTPEIENWTIPIPAELQSAGQLRVRLRLDRPFNGFLTQPTLVPDPDGTVVLPANAAITSGEKLRFEPQAYKDTVGYWVEAGDTVAWKFSTSRAGDYDVHILQGCGSGSAGSRVAARVGDEQVDFAIEETGHFQRFVWRQVGVLKLPKKSQLTLSLHVQHKPHNAVGDLRQIRLVPHDIPKSNTPESVRDIREVSPDLVVPALIGDTPRAGRRVRVRCPAIASDDIFFSLYLPVNWKPNQKFPVLVELPGNGGYRNAWVDTCSGDVADACMGYGIAGGQDAIWMVVPFLNANGTDVVRTWWGDPTKYSVDATLRFLNAALDEVIQKWGGDEERVVLAGFSRGSLACNYLGLHNDQIASRWQALIGYSHFDGVEQGWPYPQSDRASALKRLSRLGDRQEFVCMESGPAYERIREYLSEVEDPDRFSVRATGFRNHNDQWLLRPSATRRALRHWYQELP